MGSEVIHLFAETTKDTWVATFEPDDETTLTCFPHNHGVDLVLGRGLALGRAGLEGGDGLVQVDGLSRLGHGQRGGGRGGGGDLGAVGTVFFWCVFQKKKVSFFLFFSSLKNISTSTSKEI